MAKESDVERTWYVVDARDQVLGRLAARVARVLMGKHKPTYTPHTDVGDHVIVINADKVAVTGRKMEDKIYHRASGYPGGLKSIPLGELMEHRPTAPIELAVRRMLPKTKLGRKMFKKLKVYAGAEHPHSAQQPEPLEL
ncbi:MAG: 50S ribosomal protein L13 [Planctomycetota bacterium]